MVSDFLEYLKNWKGVVVEPFSAFQNLLRQSGEKLESEEDPAKVKYHEVNLLWEISVKKKIRRCVYACQCDYRKRQ